MRQRLHNSALLSLRILSSEASAACTQSPSVGSDAATALQPSRSAWSRPSSQSVPLPMLLRPFSSGSARQFSDSTASPSSSQKKEPSSAPRPSSKSEGASAESDEKREILSALGNSSVFASNDGPAEEEITAVLTDLSDDEALSTVTGDDTEGRAGRASFSRADGAEASSSLLQTPVAVIRKELFNASRNAKKLAEVIQKAEQAGLIDIEFQSLAVMFMALSVKHGSISLKDAFSRDLFKNLIKSHSENFDQLNERQFTRLLTAFANAGAQGLFEKTFSKAKIQQKIADVVGQLDGNKVVTIILSLHLLNIQPSHELYSALLDRFVSTRGVVSDSAIGSLLYSIKRIHAYYHISPQAEHLDYIIQMMLNSSDNIKVWRWVELLNDVAYIRYRPRDDILDMIVERLDKNIDNLRPSNYGQLTRAFAQLTYWPSVKVMGRLMIAMDRHIDAALGRPPSRKSAASDSEKEKNGSSEKEKEKNGSNGAQKPAGQYAPRQMLNSLDAHELITSLAVVHYYPGRRRMNSLIQLLEKDRPVQTLDTRYLAALLWAYGRLLHRGQVPHLLTICSEIQKRLEGGEKLSSGVASCALRGICTLSLYTRVGDLTSMLAMSSTGTMDRDQSHTPSTLVSRLALLINLSLFDAHPAVSILLDRIVRSPLDGLDHASLLRLGNTVDNLVALSPYGQIYDRMLRSNANLVEMINGAKDAARAFNRSLASGVDPMVAQRAQQLSAALTLLGIEHSSNALYNSDLIYYEALVPFKRSSSSSSGSSSSSSSTKDAVKLKKVQPTIAFRFYDDPQYFNLHDPPGLVRGERIGYQAIRRMVHGVTERLLSGPRWDAMQAEERVALLRKELQETGILKNGGNGNGDRPSRSGRSKGSKETEDDDESAGEKETGVGAEN